jgi:hypothetical protein
MRDLKADHQKELAAAVEKVKLEALDEVWEGRRICLAHITECEKIQDENHKLFESKECCHKSKAEIARLKKDKNELLRELALCSVCGTICKPSQHEKKMTDLKKDPKKLKGFLESLGRKE